MIHLICGPSGAGKTTLALDLLAKRKAVHLSIDKWMNVLFHPDWPPAISDPVRRIEWYSDRVQRCREVIWQVAKQLLAQGHEVSLDIAVFKRAERDHYRKLAQEAGVSFSLYYLTADKETRWARVQKRNRDRGPTFAFEVNRELFDLAETWFEPPSEVEKAIIHCTVA